MIRHICFTIAILFAFGNQAIKAQTQTRESTLEVSIPSVALINLESGASGAGTGSKATITISPNSSDDTWINYSSIVPLGNFNSIMVQVNPGQLPPDTEIVIETFPDVGLGAGETGQPIPEIILNESPQHIISSIGSCFTGTGAQHGHKIKFKWITGDPQAIANSTVDVTFTIKADQ